MGDSFMPPCPASSQSPTPGRRDFCRKVEQTRSLNVFLTRYSESGVRVPLLVSYLAPILPALEQVTDMRGLLRLQAESMKGKQVELGLAG